MARQRIMASITAALAVLMLVSFAGEVSAQSKLKPCPSSGVWHNCIGKFKWNNGDIYIGLWSHNNYHGQGTYTSASGIKYVGEFKEGNFHGQVSYTFAVGGQYIGDFKDGAMEGTGTYISADGSKYVGEFKGSKKNGDFTVYYQNGDQYVGEIKDENISRKGTYNFADGRKDVGEWKDGLLHGRSRRYAADGSITEQGIFEKDKLVKAETDEEYEFAVTASALDWLRMRVAHCWSLPEGANDAGIVTLRFQLDIDGNILGEPYVERKSNHSSAANAARAALAALVKCQPYKRLPRETYDVWSDIRMNFDPRVVRTNKNQ